MRQTEGLKCDMECERDPGANRGMSKPPEGEVNFWKSLTSQFCPSGLKNCRRMNLASQAIKFGAIC